MRRLTFWIMMIMPLGMMSAAIAADSSRNPVRTLKGAFEAALRTSESIIVSEQSIREAEAVYRQSYGDALPELSYRRTATREERSGTTRERMFRLSKTGLTGYRELAQMRSDSSTVRSRVYDRARAEQLLLSDVASAFYGLVQSREDIAATNRLVDLARDRLKELQNRVRVGRTRSADAIAQEYQITALLSQLEESKRLAESRANLLAFLTGNPIGELMVDDASRPSGLPAVDTYLSRIDSRPDVRAAKQTVESAKSDVDAAQADRMPELGMTANYYTDRPKSKAGNDWDAAFTVDMPLFDGGTRRAAVDEASAVQNQRDSEWAAVRRQADLEIRNAHQDCESSHRQLVLQKRSVELARRHYEEQLRDDRQGLVTSLDVIESLNRLNDAELGYTRARIREHLALINLEIAAGASPGDILK